MEYVLLRASELATDVGYDWLVAIDREVDAKQLERNGAEVDPGIAPVIKTLLSSSTTFKNMTLYLTIHSLILGTRATSNHVSMPSFYAINMERK